MCAPRATEPSTVENRNRWKAGCLETGTSGLGRRVGETEGRKTETALPSLLHTTIASAVSALLGAKGNPTLVLCPPHLVNKWVREVREIVPLAFAMPLYRLSDVERFVREFKRLTPGTPAFAVLSREMAKLGSGWQPAYTRRKRVLRVTDEGKQILNLYACPHCGHIVHHLEGDQETAPVLNLGYFEKKRHCFECGEPLYQMTHLNGPATPTPAESRQQLSALGSLGNVPAKETNGNSRFPIADYITRRYRGFFKLLVTDEVHQRAP